jgi:transposase
MLTAKGVKPVCVFQQVFKSTYLFGAFSPKDGDSLLMEMPQCNGECFQLFLDQLSLQNPDELKVLIEDNGAFHKVKSLKIPDNIVLIFQPPYSPEVNAAENMWARYKREFTNKLHKSLDEVSGFLKDFTNQLTPKSIMETTAFEYVLKCIN